MEETRTDWRQYRKSTHLASADVEVMQLDGKSLIFKIDKVLREYGKDVNGTKMDGEFCYFTDKEIKPIKLNTSHKNQLAVFALNSGVKRDDRHVIEKWSGLLIELFVDHNVKFKGTITDGIRIKPLQPVIKKSKPEFTESNFEAAHKAKATLETIKKSYTITTEVETKYLDYGTKN